MLRQTGITPNQYLTNYRIEKRMELHIDSALSITDIALQCGFNSSSYFTEIFHKVFGSTPSDYNKKKIRRIQCFDIVFFCTIHYFYD
jgi:AraC-like DNA-binding protein